MAQPISANSGSELALRVGVVSQRHLQFAEYRTLVSEGDRLSRYALEELERIDTQLDQQRQSIIEAEAVLGEWTGPPDVDEALDYYNRIVATVQGKVVSAEGVPELRAALSTVIAGIWVKLDEEHLHAEFELRPLDHPTARKGLAQVLSRDLAGRRMTLPDPIPGNPDELELTRECLANKDESGRRCTATPPVPGHTPSARRCECSSGATGTSWIGAWC